LLIFLIKKSRKIFI